MEQKLIRQNRHRRRRHRGLDGGRGLSKTLGKVLDIKLVESDEIGTVGVGEATIPTLVTFHRLLEINEQEFMAATQGTFKLGIGFENWRDRRRELHSFLRHHRQGSLDRGLPAFLAQGTRTQAGRRLRRLLPGAASASLEDRFAHLPRGGMNYAFHIDAGLYAKFLRKFAKASASSASRARSSRSRLDADVGLHHLDQARFGRRASKATCSSTAPAFAAC